MVGIHLCEIVESSGLTQGCIGCRQNSYRDRRSLLPSEQGDVREAGKVSPLSEHSERS